jgi:hypothetical protein
MARPQKDGLDYFPHDVYASSDEKIEPLLLLYGSKGYSFYFLHLEYIYRNANLEFDISDAETREVIYQKLKISAEEYTQILQTALKKMCFDKDYFESTGKLTSSGIKKRAAVVTEKREKMRKKYENKKNISDAETREETTPETPQSKEKKRKENESKRKVVNINSFDVLLNDYTCNEELKVTMKDFIDCRKRNKKAMTEKAVSLCLKELDKLAADDDKKIEIINQSIKKGWLTFYPLKEQDIKFVNQVGSGNQQSNGNVFFDLLKRRNEQNDDG